MKLFGEMVEETAGYLRSFVRDQEISTHLTKPIQGAPGASKVVVADAGVVSRGRIQIDDELIWVDKVDRNTNSLEVPPYGRVMDGTSAADHESGTRVIGAQLYGVEQLTLKANRMNFRYELPSYVRDVLTVMTSTNRYYSDPTYLRDWTFDKSAPLNTSTTGKALYLYDDWWDYNNDLTITVSRDPMTLTGDFQPFSDTFLPESAEDVPVLGAAARLLATADSYDVQTRAVEANTLDSKVSASAAQQQSKYLQALFMQRLDEERMRLLNATNNRARYQR